MRLIDLKTNELIEQPADIGEKFLRAGTHTINENDDFFVFNPMEESTQRVSGKDLFGRLKLGHSLVPDEVLDQELEAEAYDDADIRAGAIATIRSLTGGLSDQFITKGLGVKPETLDKLRKYNPYIEAAANIGTTVGALALPPLAATRLPKLAGIASASRFTAPAAIARAGNTVENAVGKAITGLMPATKSAIADKVLRYAPKIAGGTVEGAFYGAGQFVTEEALGDPELSGENLFAKGLEFAGDGALVGGVLTAGGMAVLDAAKKAIDFAYKSTPWIAKTFAGIEKDVVTKYLQNPLKYDDTEYTAEFIANEISSLAQQSRSKLEKGLVDADTLKKEIDYITEVAHREKSDAVPIYDGLRSHVDDWVKNETTVMKEMQPPPELVTEVMVGRQALKDRIVEDDKYIDGVLDAMDPATTITKTSNLLAKLKQLRRSSFTPSLKERGKFVTVAKDEERALGLMNEYIDMTKNYIDHGHEYLTLKQLRDYLKKIRKDVDFIGQPDFHSDQMNAILEVYQNYLNQSLKGKAPMEFFTVMENMKRNVELSKVLKKELKDEKKIADFLFNSYKKTPNNEYIRKHLDDLDVEIGTSIVPKMDNYSSIIEKARKGDRAFVDEIRSRAPYFAEMIEEGAFLEGMRKYPIDAARKRALAEDIQDIVQEYPPEVGAKMSPLSTVKAEEFDIINKNKGALGSDIDKHLNKVVDYLKKHSELEQLGKRRYIATEAAKYEQKKTDLLKTYEDFNEALLKIERSTSGNPTKIKAAFGKISELTNKDFVEMVDTLRVNSTFDKSFLRGSRNVDLWRVLLGTSLATPFIGPIAGVLSGAVMDAFGPAIAKSILKKIAQIRGSMTAQKIYKVISDEVPEFASATNRAHMGTMKEIEDANLVISEMITKTPSQYIRRSLTPISIKESQDQGDAYEENAEKVKQWLEVKDSVINNFYDDNEIIFRAAPQTTSAYFKTYQRAIDFIDKKVPRGTNDYFDEYEPADSEKFKFNRYVDYIENPSKVFKEMQEGYIPADGIEVLSSVYPTIYSRLIEQVMEDLESGKIKNMPISKRIEIKSKLGVDLAPNFNPATFAMIQANNSAGNNIDQIKSGMEQRNQTDMVRLQGKA